MKQFFQALFGESKGYVPIVLYPQSERKSKKPWKDWRLNDYHWFQWPKQAEEMVAFCHAHRKEDVYVTPALYKAPAEYGGNTKKNAKSLQVIHCDADDAKPSDFAVMPTIVVESSPRRYQLYWVLDEPVTPDKAEPVAQAVSMSGRKKGADHGWNMNKLLRVPGTKNTKPSYSNPYVSYEIVGKIYPLKKLRKIFGRNAKKANKIRQRTPGKLPAWSDVLSKIPASNTELLNLIMKEPTVTSWNPDASRYLVLFKLSCIMFRLGFSREEVFVACQHSKSDKYAQDGRSEDELWRDVLLAEDDVARNTFVFVDEDSEGNPTGVSIPDRPGIVLLTEKERKMIKPTIIDEYVKWAKTKTKADPHYHEVNAMSILSTMLSEYAYGNPQNGSMPLHMWFMVLGVTTRSYKTTAANMAMRIIDWLSDGREYPYRLADDITPEALTVSLGRRGETSNILHVDEAQGLIAGAKGEKSYLSGLIRLFTQLYDGRVPQRERTTGENTPASRTMFNVNFLGVPGKMTELLTRDDFTSGFLARFIFVIGEPAPDSPEDLWLDQGDPTKPRDMDKKLRNLMMSFQIINNHWRTVFQKHGGKQFPIMVEDGAWARWNKLQVDLVSLAKKSEDPELVHPTAKRTVEAVHRLSCLLAMADGKRTVQMRHMVTAIQYSERWFDTMLKMTRLVHANQWARQVTELVDYIGKSRSGRVSWTMAVNKFANLRSYEFAETVKSAVESGRIVEGTEERRNGLFKYLEIVK